MHCAAPPQPGPGMISWSRTRQDRCSVPRCCGKRASRDRNSNQHGAEAEAATDGARWSAPAGTRGRTAARSPGGTEPDHNGGTPSKKLTMTKPRESASTMTLTS
jgi:hypothetical protein